MPITINDIFKSMDGSLNNPKLEEFFNKTKEAAETVGQMSAERLELGRKKVECLDAKAKLSKMYERFGKLQYSLYVGENVDDNEIAEVADNIAVLKNRIEEFTADIEEAKATFNESMAAVAKKTKDAFGVEKDFESDDVEVVEAQSVDVETQE